MEPLGIEDNRILTLSTHVMRCVAERYGGTILREALSDKVAILVPKENRQECLDQIGEQLAIIREYILTSLLALREGKVIVWRCLN
ncbi:MAG: hypothetical protein JRI36_05240 [Deltaproteobacteria bacterium]|nr:hypothetical protein [Deltaproteobacteria bacterium]